MGSGARSGQQLDPVQTAPRSLSGHTRDVHLGEPRVHDVLAYQPAAMRRASCSSTPRSIIMLMAAIAPAEAQAYVKRWELVRQMELIELRRTSMDVKLRQLSALIAWPLWGRSGTRKRSAART